MKVCLVSNLYPPDVLGGAEIVVAGLARALQAAGHEVTVVSTAPRARSGWDTVEAVRVHRLAPANIYWAGEAPRRATILKPLWHTVDLWNPVMYQRLRAFLAAENPDVVHTHNLGGLSAAAWSAAAAAGVPLIHTLHDHSLTCVRAVRMTRRGRVCEQQCAPCGVRSHWLERMSRAVEAVAAPSRFVLERHLELGFFPRAQASIVPWGAPPVATTSAPARRGAHPVGLLYIGGLQAHKGVGVMLEAFRRAPGARATLDIAGAGAMAGACRAAAGRDPRIRCHGFVMGPEKARLLASADVLLLPSLCWETVGLAMLEGFASGLPVIASRTGGIPEFVEESRGILVEPGNAAALTAQIEWCAENRSAIEAMREACRAYAARLTWDRTVRELVEVYRAARGRRQEVNSLQKRSESRRL